MWTLKRPSSTTHVMDCWATKHQDPTIPVGPIGPPLPPKPLDVWSFYGYKEPYCPGVCPAEGLSLSLRLRERRLNWSPTVIRMHLPKAVVHAEHRSTLGSVVRMTGHTF